MMKALFLLVVLVVSCQAADWSWSSCGSGHYQVQSVSMMPDPPVVGQNLTFLTRGNLDEVVTGGSLTVTVYWEGIDVKSETVSICSGVKCPIPKGVWNTGKPTLIPSIAPAGSYKTHTVLTDQTGALLSCLDLFFTLN